MNELSLDAVVTEFAGKGTNWSIVLAQLSIPVEKLVTVSLLYSCKHGARACTCLLKSLFNHHSLFPPLFCSIYTEWHFDLATT